MAPILEILKKDVPSKNNQVLTVSSLGTQKKNDAQERVILMKETERILMFFRHH
jgi:hypothetical protein